MSKNGLVVDGEGWFVVNARESRWKDEGPLGSYCTFEGKRRFPHFGINISVLEPGEGLGMYHREDGQEAFLVLAGECTLIVEGEKRRLTEWDFFHCAPGTEHIIVTSGEQRAVVLAVGARGRGVGDGVIYKVCKAAARYGATVARDDRLCSRVREGTGQTPTFAVRQVPARLARRLDRESPRPPSADVRDPPALVFPGGCNRRPDQARSLSPVVALRPALGHCARNGAAPALAA
jgi:uncharacterized cupin superfamily protein